MTTKNTTTMRTFNVPVKAEVSPNNQAIFDNLQKGLGFVPNLYAVMAYSEHGLAKYLQLQGAPSQLTKKEKEVVNLVVSQVNGCRYCQSAHTVIGKMNGLTDEQVLDIRSGTAAFDTKLDALTKLAKATTLTKGRPDTAALDAFFNAGYTNAHLVEVVIAIADKVVMNYLNNIMQVPIDFPVAAELQPAKA
jgi:uncharacterized peroxidase-related enzyme